jgi:hypothetical protein
LEGSTKAQGIIRSVNEFSGSHKRKHMSVLPKSSLLQYLRCEATKFSSPARERDKASRVLAYPLLPASSNLE